MASIRMPARRSIALAFFTRPRPDGSTRQRLQRRIMTASNVKIEGEAVGCGTARLSLFVFLWSSTLLTCAHAEPRLQCNRDNMPAADVKACADLLNDPLLSPSDRSSIHAARAAQWMREDEPAAAVADYSRAIDADKTNFAALTGRARAYAALGEHKKAAADWSRIIALKPDNSDIYSQRGRSHLENGNTDAALADFTRAIELNPKNTEAFIGRAWVYDKLNDRKRVLQEFELAIVAGPELWSTYLARAELADRWGDKQMAIDNYELVIKYNHRYWDAYKALHRLGVDHYFGKRP